MARVLCVVGPTATGKTKMGVALAQRFGGEVVSVFGGPPPLDGESAIVSTNGNFTEELRKLM